MLLKDIGQIYAPSVGSKAGRIWVATPVSVRSSQFHRVPLPWRARRAVGRSAPL